MESSERHAVVPQHTSSRRASSLASCEVSEGDLAGEPRSCKCLASRDRPTGSHSSSSTCPSSITLIHSCYSTITYPELCCIQAAIEKLTTNNSDQKAALTQAEHDADDRRTSYDGNVANAVADASNQQRAQFEGQMTEAKLAVATMKHAFDQLTTENTELKAAFVSHLAKAKYDAGDMKVSIIGVLCALILYIYLLMPLSMFHFSFRLRSIS